MSYCLDTWAVVRWLSGEEPAFARIEELLPDRPWMSWISVGEVCYVVHRDSGEGHAAEVVRGLRSLFRLDLATPQRVIEAARIKAVHAVSYADAFAVATAAAHGAILLTGDPEILEAGAGWPTEDLR